MSKLVVCYLWWVKLGPELTQPPMVDNLLVNFADYADASKMLSISNSVNPHRYFQAFKKSITLKQNAKFHAIDNSPYQWKMHLDWRSLADVLLTVWALFYSMIAAIVLFPRESLRCKSTMFMKDGNQSIKHFLGSSTKPSKHTHAYLKVFCCHPSS